MVSNLKKLFNDQPVYLEGPAYRVEDGIRDLMNRLPSSSIDVTQWFSSENLPDLVRTHFTDLWQLARAIQTLLQRGVAAIVVENLPFAQLDLTETKRVLLAFAICIGRPISADPHRPNLMWEVSSRTELPPSYTPTVTEHNGAAALHTDSSFKSTPEACVLLYAHQPASDGGGLSQLLSANRLMARLADNKSGRECSRLLRLCSFPFRVPTVFTKRRRDSFVEWVTAPIFSDQPQIRYRNDLIASALECGLTSLSPEAEWALSHLQQELQKLSPYSFALRRGDLLVLNNHLVLHGRTAFEDPARMLLRIRLATAVAPHFRRQSDA